MTIYQIDEAIMGCIDMETGEVDIDKLTELQMLRDEKIENIGCWVKQLKAESEALKAEEKALADRRKAKENKVESLQNYLSAVLGGQKYETTKVSINFRHNQKVEITDFTKIPDNYLRYKEPEPNKTAIKAAIKDGIKIDGAELVDTISMSIK